MRSRDLVLSADSYRLQTTWTPVGLVAPSGCYECLEQAKLQLQLPALLRRTSRYSTDFDYELFIGTSHPALRPEWTCSSMQVNTRHAARKYPVPTATNDGSGMTTTWLLVFAL